MINLIPGKLYRLLEFVEFWRTPWKRADVTTLHEDNQMPGTVLLFIGKDCPETSVWSYVFLLEDRLLYTETTPATPETLLDKLEGPL